MYRRNKTNGTWVLKVSNGHGAYWTKAFALADDFEDADAKNVLTFFRRRIKRRSWRAAMTAAPTVRRSPSTARSRPTDAI